jgi:hypothetical protein
VRHPSTTPGLLFADLFDRPLTATFDVPDASSDGGAVLLKVADRRLGLIPRLAAALVDERQPGKARHALADLLGQRIYGLALGYDGANDAARLADDPLHKPLLGRDPVTGDALASQPTLSRFENDVTRGELLALSEAPFEAVLARHTRRRRKLRRITIDLDVTDDPTHGAERCPSNRSNAAAANRTHRRSTLAAWPAARAHSRAATRRSLPGREWVTVGFMNRPG